MNKFYAHDILGQEAFDEMLNSNVAPADIKRQATERFDGVKQILGEDRFKQIREAGYDFTKIEEVAHYVRDTEAKKAEEKKYAEEVAYAKDEFKKEYAGTDFKDRLDRGVGRVLTELNVAAHNLVGAKPDPQRVGFLEADDEIAGAWEKAHRTPEEQKIYEEKEKAFADAKGTVDTITTGADMLWQKVKNPSEWDMAGFMSDIANPINLAGGGAGAVATKALANTALKGGTKVAIGSGTAAVTDGALGYGYDYNVQKGRGRSDEEATKAATLGLAANVAMGAGTGAFTSILTHRFAKNSDTTPKANPQSSDDTLGVDGPNAPDKTFSMMDGTVISKDEFDLMSADEVLKELDQDQIMIPDDIKNSALLKVVGEAEDHSSKAMKIIKTIDETTAVTAEREAKVAKYAPPTEFETYVNKALNDSEVAPSMYGSRARNKLEISIENADMITMEHVNAKLDEYGIVGEHKAVMLDAYARRDIGYYDDWATSKIEQKGEADARANAGNGREDTTIQTDRVDDVDAGVRETVDANAEPEALPEPNPRGREDTEVTGRDPGNIDTETGLPKESEGVDGYGTVREDDGVIRGDRTDDLVQNEDGVRVDEGVETPTQIYERLKDEPAISNEEKARLRKASEAYDIEELSYSDGVVSKSDNGFELKSYPLRVEEIDTILKSPEGEKVSKTLSYVDDVNLNNALEFKKDLPVQRVINNSDVKHIFKEHGDVDAEAARGQIAVDRNDIANYPDIVAAADLQSVVTGKNKVKRVLSAKQINGHYIVVEEVSTKKNTLNLKTMWKVKGELSADALRSIDGGSPTLIVRNALGAKPNESMPPPRKAPVIKSISEEMNNVKKLSDLTSHRYFDDMVEAVKSQSAKENLRPKRETVAALKESLEKRGLDKSDVVYKAEMSKLFKKSNTKTDDGGFHSYSDAEIKKIEAGDIDPPIARKLRDDLREYAANPKWKQNRAEIDGGYRAFSDEAAILREMEIDERLGLVESESFRDGYDVPLKVDDIGTRIDELDVDSNENVITSDLDAFFGRDDHIELSDMQNRVLAMIDNPMKRETQKKKFELKTLEEKLESAESKGDWIDADIASIELKKWKDENMRDGKIREIGDC